MTSEITPTGADKPKIQMKYQGSSDTVYAMGIFGAWYFYLSRAKNLQEGILGFFKGLFWPGFLVYELLKFLTKD